MASILNLDKVAATKSGRLESVKHTAELQNGMVVNLGALATGEREVFDVSVPATATLATAEVLLIAAPEVMYEGYKGLKDFTITAGTATKAYRLETGDIFTVTDDAITGTTVVGQYVIPANASLKLAAAADLTGGTKFAAKVIEKGTLGYDGAASTTVQVIKV